MRRLGKIALTVVVLLGGVWGAYAYLNREEAVKVTVIKPARLTIEEVVTATGSVEASRTVVVVLEPGSRIVSTHFREQDHVRKGQLLATLDETELVAQLSQNRANLALAETNLAGGEVTRDRLRRLYDKGFAARQDVENAERQVELYKAQIADRTAAIALIQAKLARTSIVSPITGIVTRKMAEEGGSLLVNSNEGPVRGQPTQTTTSIAEIADLESTQFNAAVDQADIGKIRVGQAATVQLDALPQRTFQAVTREITVASNPDPTGRVRYGVKMALASANKLPKIGMTGSAKFVIAKKTQVLALAPSVILQQGDEELVYVLEGDKAVLKKIKTGLQGEEMVEVVSGLSPEDLVIDQGRAKIRNGRRVQLLDAKR